MAYLFKVEGKTVYPNDEVLLISPFKEIWERDKSKGKDVARQEFSYIEFMTSYLKSNPYKGYAAEIKHKVIKEAVIKEDKWEVDDLIKEAMSFIHNIQKDASPTYSLYLSTLVAKDKLENFFQTVDLDERNFKSGMPVYKPKELSSAMMDVDKLTASLAALKKKVEEELFDEVKIKGQKEVSPFADPNSLFNRG